MVSLPQGALACSKQELALASALLFLADAVSDQFLVPRVGVKVPIETVDLLLREFALTN